MQSYKQAALVILFCSFLNLKTPSSPKKQNFSRLYISISKVYLKSKKSIFSSSFKILLEPLSAVNFAMETLPTFRKNKKSE